MLALIDSDIVLHRVGYTTNDDGEWIAKARTNEMLEGILQDTCASDYQLYLSDSRENNFRTQLWTGYKANRTQPRPTHYDFIKELLITEWGARIAHGMEADDALAISQDKDLKFGKALILREGADTLQIWRDNMNTVICSIDKDLKQVAGLHYNFVKKEWDEVTPEQGRRNFFASILVGDTVDNIRGCRGIGPVKAKKALADCTTDEEFVKAIIEVYKKQEEEMSTEEILAHILLAGQLLKIKQEEGEKLWGSPLLQQKGVV